MDNTKFIIFPLSTYAFTHLILINIHSRWGNDAGKTLDVSMRKR